VKVTLLGTGSPIPDPNRAGPSTLVQAAGQHIVVDCLGVTMTPSAMVKSSKWPTTGVTCSNKTNGQKLKNYLTMSTKEAIETNNFYPSGPWLVL